MAINYTEKGIGLHDAIVAAGHWLHYDSARGWLCSDEAAVQAIIDAYDPLAPARAAKWDEIRAERERRKNAGYMAGGYRFHSDANSRIQQLGLLMMGANLPPGIQWKTLSGEFVEMTPQLAAAIFAATAAADTALFGAAEAHRATVDAMADWQAVAAYDCSSGWPEV